MSESLDPDAAARVLRRAGELAGEHDLENDGIEPAAIVAAATEVGIPELAVRRSLAIEQLGPPPRPGRLDTIAGPAVVVDERIVALAPDEVLGLLDDWLSRGHHLRRERHRPGEMTWARRDDLVGGARRAMRGLSGEGRLGHVRSVHATAREVVACETALRVTLDRRGQRLGTVVGGSTLGAGAVAVGVIGIVATAPIAFAAIPAGVASGLVLVAGRHQADRFERELHRMLDEIEQRNAPIGVFTGFWHRLSGRSKR